MWDGKIQHTYVTLPVWSCQRKWWHHEKLFLQDDFYLVASLIRNFLTRQDPNTQMEPQIPLCGNKTVWSLSRGNGQENSPHPSALSWKCSFWKKKNKPHFQECVFFPEEEQNKFAQSLMPEKALARVIFFFWSIYCCLSDTKTPSRYEIEIQVKVLTHPFFWGFAVDILIWVQHINNLLPRALKIPSHFQSQGSEIQIWVPMLTVAQRFALSVAHMYWD